MAIPSGSYRVSTYPKQTRPAPFPAAPPKSKRKEINQIVKQTFTNVNQERVMNFSSLVDMGNGLAKIYFTPAQFIWGKLQPSNIKENYLYVNGVYVKKSNYTIYEEDTSIVVEIINNIGYTILPTWNIELRIRASV